MPIAWIATAAQMAWFVETLHRHVKLHFRREVLDAVEAVPLHILPIAQITGARSPGIYLANDVSPELSGEPSTIAFSGTTIALVQPLPRPTGAGWMAIEASGTPVWWRNASGVITPAWNFYGVCVGLLSAIEEVDVAPDRYGGFPLSASPRAENGLFERPTVNEIFALMVAAALTLHERQERWFDVGGRVLPPLLFLSHDCDNLFGNSIWLQLARAKRLVVGTSQRAAPDFKQAGWALKGWCRPEEGFASEVDDFMRVEELHGFASRFYFLLGERGRYGARAAQDSTLAVARRVRPPHEIGLHYNHSAQPARTGLPGQIGTLGTALRSEILSGRAHYLSFRSDSAPEAWESVGLGFDESFGSADRPIFRLGFAGVFRWFSRSENRQLKLVECPLLFMDSAVAMQWPDDPFRGVWGWARHIEAIGGSLSFLFHPGFLANPEFQEDATLYPRLLEALRARGARQIATRDLLVEFGIDQDSYSGE